MDFIVFDKDIDAKFREILARIRRLQSGGTVDSMKNVGAETEGQVGASYLSLKELAANYETDERLASALWLQKRREEQIVACFLFPYNLNREKIMQLIQSCAGYEVAGYFGSVYLSGYPELSVLHDEWLASENPYMQTSVLTAMAKHLIIYKENAKISVKDMEKACSGTYTDKYVRLIAERYRFNI